MGENIDLYEDDGTCEGMCNECSGPAQPFIRILIGLPRSGKTTYANSYRGLWPIISADELRYLVYGQRFWGFGEDLLWAIRKVFLVALMKQGIDIVIDETNTTKSRRAPIIKLAKEYGYRVEGIWFKTPPEVCIERAIKEGQEDLIPIIKRMADQFEPPTVIEESATDNGEFDYIKIVPTDIFEIRG